MNRANNKTRHETMMFFLFISPWLIGFIGLTLGPLIASIGLSFTDWNLFNAPEFVGAKNYVRLFTKDDIFWKALYNTFYYALIAIPLSQLLSLFIAFLLNQKVSGMRMFRTAYYLPSVVPVVASSMVFRWILAPKGIINKFIGLFGISGPAWLLDEKFVMFSFVFMALWGVGSSMILLLSSMQGISQELYESAAIDGAGPYRSFIKITVPMITPVIFFNLIMGVIGSLQTFSQVYILTGGGPNNASMMIVPYLFNNAFKYYKMGYASSIAWVLFVIILCLTLVVFKSSSLWVYYEGEVKK